MATEIKTWQIIDGKLTQISSTLVENKKKEKEDLERWIKSSPEILGQDIVIIGEQVNTKSGFLHFLGIDSTGNAVIVELKRDSLPREVLAQVIDYASDVSSWDVERFNEICLGFTSRNLEDYLTEKFPGITIEDMVINQAQRLLLVGFSVEEPLNRMVEWLSQKYDVGINVIVLCYVKTKSGDEMLSRTVIIPEEVEKEKTNIKKYVIPMSNEPGKYETQELKEELVKYLSKDLWSTKRIKDYFLPILLKNDGVTREQLKKEFVKMGAAPDEGQAGYFLSLISNQLGHKRKDYLRQIVSYEYPNYPWEKDKFRINDEYKELVKEILESLKK